MGTVDIILAPDPDELDPDIQDIDSDIADLTDLRGLPAVRKKSERPSIGAHVLKLADPSDENPALDLDERLASGPEKKRTKLLSARFARFAARLIDLCWEGAITTLAVGTLLVNTMGAPTSMLVYYLLFLIILPATLLLDTVVQAVFGNTPGKLLFGLKAVTWRGAKIGFRAALSRNFLLWRSGFACGFLPLIPFTLASQFSHVGKGSRSSYDARQHLRVRYQPPPLLAQIVIIFGVLAIILTPIYQTNSHAKFFKTIAGFDLSRVSVSSDNGEIVYLEPESPLNANVEPEALAAQLSTSPTQGGNSAALEAAESTESNISEDIALPTVEEGTSGQISTATEYDATAGTTADTTVMTANQIAQDNLTETTPITANEATADRGTTIDRVVTAEEFVTFPYGATVVPETSATPEKKIVLDSAISEIETGSTIDSTIATRESSSENGSEEDTQYQKLEQLASIESDINDSSTVIVGTSASGVESTLSESYSPVVPIDQESNSNVAIENNSITPQSKIEEAVTGDPEISILAPLVTESVSQTDTATKPWTNPFSGFSTEIDSIWKTDTSDLADANAIVFRSNREDFQIILSRETNDLELDLPNLANSFQAQHIDQIAFFNDGRVITYDGKRVWELSGKQIDDSTKNFLAQLYLNDNNAYFIVVESDTKNSSLQANGEQLVTTIWRTIE